MAEAVESDQPLTPAGRLFLQPKMDQVINAAVTVVSPLDADAIKAEVRSSIMLRHPRFCSLMVRDSRGRERWRRTAVDVDRHFFVRRESLAGDGSISDEDAVSDFVADLAVSSPLPADKPLWEIHLLLAHNTAVFRLHHALGDGISLMSMLLSCCRRADDPARTPSIGGVGAAKAAPTRRRWSVWTLVMAVWFTLIYCLEFTLRALWLGDKTTAVSGGDGVELWPRKLVTARFRLEDMKIVKRVVADADMSKLMNSNSKTQWGNKFGMLLLPIYYHRCGSDPIQFVKRAKSMIDKKKLSLEAPFSYKVGNLIMSLFGAKLACILNYRIVCNTTFTISNVIGPREEITMAGNPVKHIRVTSSSLPHAITMHMVSYAGIADLQILAAKEIIPDPKVLAKCFEDALLEMKEIAEAAGKS